MFITRGSNNGLTMPGGMAGLAASMVGALLVIGCGGDDDDPAPPTATATQCTVDSIKTAIARLAPMEGNVTVETAEARTGGSFTPPGATQPLAGLPDFCRVIAVAQPTTDSQIRMEVWLPTSGWGNRYLSVGEGGLHGAINYTGLSSGVKRGYATASTDTGHLANDTWWMVGHPEKVIDAGYRGKHLQATTAKAVIEAFYAQKPARSYHIGCSGGGREGMISLQRYPSDYDGYVIGAPANNWTGQVKDWIMKAQLMSNPATAIPVAKEPAIQAAAVAQCDAVDGLSDGIISSPRQCTFNADALACPAGQDNNTCLTAGQVTSLKTVLRGPVDSAGRLLFPGDEPGTNIAGADKAGSISPWWNTAFGISTVGGMLYNRTDWDYRTFNFDAEAQLLETNIGPIFNANNPDLRVQKARGIKVIQYHGWADQALAPGESINYYDRVVGSMGGLAQTQDFYRLFMAPGMAHCFGGPGPNDFGQAGGESVRPALPGSSASDDILKALESWVEQGVAPAQIIATKFTGDDATRPVIMRRPLCPHPLVAKYKGGNVDPNVASSFACASP